MELMATLDFGSFWVMDLPFLFLVHGGTSQWCLLFIILLVCLEVLGVFILR